MTPAELTSAEERLEAAGWTITTRSYGPGCWYGNCWARGGAFRYSADGETRHDARERVCELALETQAQLDAHRDTEMPTAAETAAE